MTDTALLGPWVRRFLLEHLVGERNLARNTQQSYRDTLRLLLPFSASRLRKPIDQLRIEDLSADHIREFLQDLEIQRALQRRHAQSTPGGDSFVGPFHRPAQSGTRRLVRRNQGRSVQAGAAATGDLPGKGRDGRIVGGAGLKNGVRPPRSGAAAVSVQHGLGPMRLRT